MEQDRYTRSDEPFDDDVDSMSKNFDTDHMDLYLVIVYDERFYIYRMDCRSLVCDDVDRDDDKMLQSYLNRRYMVD